MPLSAVWPEVEVFDDHHRWRPEWTEDRACLYWYVTFAEQPAVAELADLASGRLGTLPGFDAVPSSWLHLTLCDIGFLDEVDGSRLEAMTEAVAEELRIGHPLDVTLGPVAFFPDSVTLAAGPSPALLDLRERVGRAMESVGLESEHHPVHDFWPHVTLAYANRRVAREAVLDALGDAEATRRVAVQQVTLAAVSRRHGHYQWDARAVIALDGSGVRRQQEATGAPSSTGSVSTP